MTNFEIFVLSVALSLDAMLVSFSYGLIINKKRVYNSLLLALFFGFFQFLMPVIGSFLTSFFYEQLAFFSKWIVFTIFLFLGLKFLKSAFETKEKIECCCISLYCLFFLAIATSIDALGAGVSFKLLDVSVFKPSVLIGIVTFVFSFSGFWFANLFKKFSSSFIEIIGALLLIYLAIKAIL